MDNVVSRRGVSATVVTLFGVVAILIGMVAFTALTVYLVRAYQTSTGIVESYAEESKSVVKVYAVLFMENSTDRVLNKTVLIFENLRPDEVKIDHVAVVGSSGSLLVEKETNIVLNPGQAGWIRPSELDSSLAPYDEDFWKFKREVEYLEIHIDVGGSGSSFKSYPIFLGQPVVRVEGAGIPTVVLIFIHSSTNKRVTDWKTKTVTTTTTPTNTITETETLTVRRITITVTSIRSTTTTTRITLTTTSTPTYVTTIYFTVSETVCSEKTLPVAYIATVDTTYSPMTVTKTVVVECSGTVCQTVTASRSGCSYQITTRHKGLHIIVTTTKVSASTITTWCNLCGACDIATKRTTITPTVTLSTTTYKTTRTNTITRTTTVTVTATAQPKTTRTVTFVTVTGSIRGTETVTTTITLTSTVTSTRTNTLYAPATTITSPGTTTMKVSEIRCRGSTTTLTLTYEYPTITTVNTTITVSCQQSTRITVTETSLDTIITRRTTATLTVYNIRCMTGTP